MFVFVWIGLSLEPARVAGFFYSYMRLDANNSLFRTAVPARRARVQRPGAAMGHLACPRAPDWGSIPVIGTASPGGPVLSLAVTPGPPRRPTRERAALLQPAVVRSARGHAFMFCQC